MAENLHMNPAWSSLFQRYGLDHFDALWTLDVDDVEPGNQRRGGFSRVAWVQLGGQQVFLKRQENQIRRTLRHPLGRPTYFFEYRYLRALGPEAPVAECCLYAERTLPDRHQSILVTRALTGFRDLESRAEAGESLLKWMPAVGELAWWFHRQHLQHMAVQPCHLFINDAGECRIIDLERTRRRASIAKAAERDLRQLVRRSPWLDAEHLKALLGAYPVDLADSLFEALAPRLRADIIPAEPELPS